MRARTLLLFLFIICSAAIVQPCPGQADDLIKVVILSRHGVRSPTQHHKMLNSWSQKTWPEWPVERGELTDRGAGLVTEMWKNMRDYYAALNLMPARNCPEKDKIYVRADVDERTRATAAAILDGVAPGCGLGFAVLPDAKVDPLFHPLKADLYHLNPMASATAVIHMADGSLGGVEEEFSIDMHAISDILGTPSSALCARFAMVPNCTLTDLPNAVSVSPNGTEIRLMGALDIASSVTEIFLLEYAQWPGKDAGWGMVNARLLENLLPVHAKVFDLVNRASVVAWAKGGPLLNEMARALTNSHYDARINDAKLVIFVGHDTNIANLGALLNASWKLDKYPRNGIPPGGALALELWENQGSYYVTAKFFAQPLKALHTPLPGKNEEKTSDFAPIKSIVSLGNPTREWRYGVEDFLTLVQNATQGGPRAPESKPPFFYGKVEPKPRRGNSARSSAVEAAF